jgi:ankyrin repeat protein
MEESSSIKRESLSPLKPLKSLAKSNEAAMKLPTHTNAPAPLSSLTALAPLGSISSSSSHKPMVAEDLQLEYNESFVGKAADADAEPKAKAIAVTVPSPIGIDAQDMQSAEMTSTQVDQPIAHSKQSDDKDADDDKDYTGKEDKDQDHSALYEEDDHLHRYYQPMTLEELTVKSRQKEDDMFYSSMQLNIHEEVLSASSSSPLHQAVVSKQVKLVLSLLAKNADIPSLIASRDEKGRTLLHLACLSRSETMVRLLFRAVIDQQQTRLFTAQQQVDAQRATSKRSYFLKNQAADSKRVKRCARWQLINQWFDDEKARLHRQSELALENWYMKVMSTADDDGRSPLHYAIAVNAPREVLEALLGYALPASLHGDTVYDLMTGHLMASASSSSTLTTGSSRRDIHVLEDSMIKGLRHESSWDLGNNATRASPSLNYEIMIPWLIRNILKRCKDKLSYRSHSSTSANEISYLANQLVKIDEDSTGFLLVAEVKQFLISLDIRVTLDSIRELCRRYPSAAEATIEKFQSMKRRHDRLRRSQEEDDEAADAKSSDSRRASDQMKPTAYIRFDDHKHSSSESFQSDEKASRSMVADDGKHGQPSKMSSEQKNHDANADDQLKMVVDFDLIDESLGLDIEAFLDDIRIGRALKGIDIDGLSHSRTLPSDSHTLTLPVNENTVRLPALVTTNTIRNLRKRMLNRRDIFGRTALCLAVALSQSDHAELLLSQGADVTAMTTNGSNAFNLSSERSIQNLLEASLVKWLNQRQRQQYDSHHPAINQSTEDVFVTLLPQMKTLTEKHWSYSKSPLSWAITSGHIDCVKMMIGQGVDVNYRDVSGRSVLHDCAAICRLSNSIEIVQAVLAVSEELMNNGMQANIISVSGRNALHEVFCMNQDESVRYAYLAEYNASYTRSITAGVHMTHELIHWKSMFVRNLISWGVDALAHDRHGFTPIHYCARENMVECLVELLTTPLPSTSANDDETPSKERFLDARIRTKVGGHSPLHMACMAGAMKTAQVLMRWDADYCMIGSSLRGMKNQQGKLPEQLIPGPANSNSSDRLDNIWRAARDGSKERLMKLLHHHREKSMPAADTIDDDSYPPSLSSSKILRSWLDNNLDAKSRRMRWTVVHCCIIGWAEHSLTASKRTSKIAFDEMISVSAENNKKKLQSNRLKSATTSPSKVAKPARQKQTSQSMRDLDYSNTLAFLIKVSSLSFNS